MNKWSRRIHKETSPIPIMKTINGTSPVRIKAFTLIELLTVIAIIGILAAILIPVVGKVRESARAAQCVSNIRQIAIAMLTYADENNGRLPTSGSTEDGQKPESDWILWYRPSDNDLRDSAIVPYMGGAFTADIYRCPSDERLAVTPLPPYRFSFSLNRALGEFSNSPKFAGLAQLNGQVHNVPDPSLIILIAEEAAPNDSSAWLGFPEDSLTERHGGRGHVAFVDAHVESVYPEFARFPGHWNPFHTGTRPYEGRR
jgi:prepilin-type N-terminal cleavage/methylation domain-containing protein/prepilin-type processing-associated H-X9-DG protein